MGLAFDGVDDHANLTDIAALDGVSAITWAFWIKPDILRDGDVVINKSDGVDDGFLHAIRSTGLVRGHIYTGSGAAYGDTPTGMLVNGTWAHVAIVFDGSGVANADRLKIYINGVAQTLAFTGTVPAATTGNTNVYRLGADVTPAQFFDGVIDLHKVWTAALAEAQVQAEMWSYRPSRTANLLMFHEGDFTVDYSGNGHGATLVGAAAGETPPVGLGIGVL